MIQFHDHGDAHVIQYVMVPLFDPAGLSFRKPRGWTPYLDLGEAHVHTCTTCYRAMPCWMECTEEPDFTAMAGGVVHGSYAQCDECVAVGVPDPQDCTEARG